ncbi:uncharacterized protein LOC123441451 [Hordeum vulgare subsp. vulgare]|uniref:DUF1618 domain-containing protein n=1 Tax=Hordeum vulgare subsp. vulgare TaxID=112509 RepID=A0A8I6XV85_HORVV|nr:uncharacterized protein LOC123441451 [Hordeum vulgare subsp. vulgare]
MASAAASPAPAWVILGSVPRVLTEAAALPPGPGAADFSLALLPPPRVALLTIPPRIFPSRPTSASFPCVLAADPSAGLLLLHADQGRATGPTVIDKPGCQQFGWLPFVAGYYVLDAAAGSALPLPTPELVSYKGDLGLIAYPDGDGYLVAELQPVFGSDKAVLLRFPSKVGEWVRERVAYPLPARLHSPHGVVSCYGRLWWVDLSWCLVTCDPFADDPVLTRPTNPDVVYFFLDENLIGVDVRARKVVGCEVYELVDEPPREGVASSLVHAWQLPPDLTLYSGSAKETVNDNGICKII